MNPVLSKYSRTAWAYFRDRLGFKRYRKTAKRDPEKRQLLLEPARKRTGIRLGQAGSLDVNV